MANMQKVQLNEPRMFGAQVPLVPQPDGSATPRYDCVLREVTRAEAEGPPREALFSCLNAR